jgi:hypothetical protein
LCSSWLHVFDQRCWPFLGIRCLRSGSERYDLAGLRSRPAADGSPYSEAALRWALDEAAARGGSVSALFCWQGPFLSIPGAFDREELEQTYKNYVNEIVSAVAPSPRVPLVLGSVSQRCAAASPCPVVLVKRAEEESG